MSSLHAATEREILELRHPQSAQRNLFRIYLELRPGCLVAALERLQVAGQYPRLMVFHNEAETRQATLILGFDRVNEIAARALIEWVEEIPGVLTVSTGWPPPEPTSS